MESTYFMSTSSRKLSAELFALLSLTAVTFVLLLLYLPTSLLAPLFVVALVAFLYFGAAVVLAKYQSRTPDWLNTAPLWLIVMVPVAVGVALLLRFWVDATIYSIIFVLGMLFIFLYYWLMVPFAMVQKIEVQNWDGAVEEWPAISVLVPAYKERGYIGRTLDSIGATTYPGDLELIVIDDGSLDGTYEEAIAHATTDATVIQKENGGKHSALNKGLELARNDIIVSIDADSWVAPDAFEKLVERFERNPEAGAVAGNVKVGNRGSFITNVQALEYIVGINTFRRAFDHVGLVSVVPGCLGAFRAETLHDIKGYSADTLTEDFDLTIEILKRGQSVHMSEGVVYTSAPTTWRGLYRQRLRWFRGHVQTLRKHAHVFTDRGYGLLQRLVFPYAFLSMTLFPLLGIAVSVAIPLSIIQGEGWLMAQIAVFFFVLLSLLSLLAIEIDGERRRLTVYAPLSIIGYKQFLDIILIKSLFDVFSGRNLEWTGAGRVRPEHSDSYDSETAVAESTVTEESSAPIDVDADSGFDIYEDASGNWRWRLRHSNGADLAVSGREFDSRADAQAAADRVADHMDDADVLYYDPAGFEISRQEDGEWRWKLRTRNGRAVARSHQGYDSRSGAREAIEQVKKHAEDDDRWSVIVGQRGGYHWRLTAPNGTVLARNVQRYDSDRNAQRVIKRVRAAVPEADVLQYDPAGFEIYADADDAWRWRLQHRDGRTLATSDEQYGSRAVAMDAVETLQSHAAKANIAER
jgi:biofilm PGA synthesis N-glycosyltransferase PgaC